VPVGVSVLVKAIAGGSLVVVFAVIGSVLRPRWLAGLFGAAPSIAIAGLVVTVADSSIVQADRAAEGMIVGAIAFVFYAGLARLILNRCRAVAATALATLSWIAVAVGGYLVVLR
jgi:uncharacterized membrane protein (GlpM family)